MLRRTWRAASLQPVLSCRLPLESPAAQSDMLAAFKDWCATHAGTTADVLLPLSALHEMVCEPGLPLETEEALLDYGRQQFIHYFGSAASSWPLAAWQAKTGSATPESKARPAPLRGVTALAGMDLAALERIAGQHRVRLRHVRPAWAPGLAQVLSASVNEGPSSFRFVCVEAGLAMLAVIDQGRLVELKKLRLATPSEEALREAVDEAAADGPQRSWPLQMDLADAGLQPRSPNSTRGGLAGPDFLSQRVRRTWLAAPLAWLAALVLGLSAADAWDQHEALAAQQAQRVAVEQSIQAATARNSERVEGQAQAQAQEPTAPSALPRERLRAYGDVAQALSHPWAAVLEGVERAGEGTGDRQTAVQWLSLSYLPAKSDMRLEGFSADKLAAIQAVSRLSAVAGWQDVTLRRFSGERGQPGQRFEIGARVAAAVVASPPRQEDRQ